MVGLSINRDDSSADSTTMCDNKNTACDWNVFTAIIPIDRDDAVRLAVPLSTVAIRPWAMRSMVTTIDNVVAVETAAIWPRTTRSMVAAINGGRGRHGSDLTADDAINSDRRRPRRPRLDHCHPTRDHRSRRLPPTASLAVWSLPSTIDGDSTYTVSGKNGTNIMLVYKYKYKCIVVILARNVIKVMWNWTNTTKVRRT